MGYIGEGASNTVLQANTSAAPTFTGSPSVSGSVTAATGLFATTGGVTSSAGGLTVTNGTTQINLTGTATTSIASTNNSGTISIGNTSSAAVKIDSGTAGISIGTTANAHSTTLGSTNSTSATTVQSGSGALNVTATNGALTINSGTGALGISTDASATTISFATGGAVKTVTLGSTNSTSATTVQSGSGAVNVTAANGQITMNSGAASTQRMVIATTGVITMNASDSGNGSTLIVNSIDDSPMKVVQSANDANSAKIDFQKNRSGGVITSGDIVGNLRFYAYDGTQYTAASKIMTTSSGTIASQRVAGQLEFYTHPDSTSGGTDATQRAFIQSDGDFVITSTDSGVTRTLTVRNTSNTASSAANIKASTAGATAADATYQATTTTTPWTWGVDNSVTSPTADPFVISQGTTLGTNNIMSVATSGEINYPLQPAFSASLGATVLNKTGAAAFYQLGTDALTEIFDQNGDFNTNGTLTAPVTGLYMLNAGVQVTGCTIATAFILILGTSNRNYIQQFSRAASALDNQQSISQLADMDAADTSIVNIQVAGEAGNTDDIVGAATTTVYTYFNGYLAC